MRKVMIVVSVLVLTGTLTITAFGGGLVVGRFVTLRNMPNSTPCPTPLVVPPDTSSTDTENQPPQVNDKPSNPSKLTAFDYEALQTVLDLLDKQFYGEIPDGQTLAYGAIRGMLLTLDDPYTSFIDPQISAIMNEDASGHFEGIGAMVNMREDGYLEIASLISGQPAEAAGILPGDLILAVGEQSIVGLGLYEAISYIRGPAGTDAILKIARSDEAEPIIITVTRARIEMPIVEYEMLEHDIAYISLTEFDATAAERVEKALQELLKENPAGLIFDLRSNPGGWLDQAIKVSDVFLDKGLVAIERDSSGGEQKFYSYNGDMGEDIPLVVLVNGGSASASEIVAGALQDRGRATLIGQETLGKGSVQRPNNLDDGSQLRVTIARWFTPDNKSIHGEGLTPDIEQDYPRDTPVDEDPQLERATEYLLQGR